MSKSYKRRDFHKQMGALALGFMGLSRLSVGQLEAAEAKLGYGPLVKDPKGVFDLPAGFDYRIISRTGDIMDDGWPLPGKPDGMASFKGPDGKIIIVRNHELQYGDEQWSVFGKGLSRLSKIDKEWLYDFGHGQKPGLGGTTTLLYKPKTGKLEKQFLSLAGTLKNCAGGPTPWNSWISCEEHTASAKRGGAERDHGYAFEVPARADGKLNKPVPLTAMGRFCREAVAFDKRSGAVYQTEDQREGLIYRFIPKEPRRLAKGGRLEALALCDQDSADLRNWPKSKPKVEPHKALKVRWIALEEVKSPKDDLRLRGYQKGAARFARPEGIWAGDGELYFSCTEGGSKRKGQIWRYQTSPYEGSSKEAKQPGQLTLIAEPNDSAQMDNCDNITIAPWGHLFVCEDGSNNHKKLRVVTPKGQIFDFGRNAFNDSELAGAHFSPDGQVLFVNIQKRPGMTLAISGPWKRALKSLSARRVY